MFRNVRSLISTVDEFNNNGGAHVLRTSYAYDPLRQIVSVTDDRNNVTGSEYDLFGRRTAIDNPDTGRTVFVYELADNLTARETASGQRITCLYEFNRLSKIRYPLFPANNVTYTYGAASLLGQAGNRVGRITRITDAAGTEDRLYRPLGEIVEESRTIPLPGGQPKTYVTRYQYDTWNRLQGLTYLDAEILTYGSSGLHGGFRRHRNPLRQACREFLRHRSTCRPRRIFARLSLDLNGPPQPTALRQGAKAASPPRSP